MNESDAAVIVVREESVGRCEEGRMGGRGEEGTVGRWSIKTLRWFRRISLPSSGLPR